MLKDRQFGYSLVPPPGGRHHTNARSRAGACERKSGGRRLPAIRAEAGAEAGGGTTLHRAGGGGWHANTYGKTSPLYVNVVSICIKTPPQRVTPGAGPLLPACRRGQGRQPGPTLNEKRAGPEPGPTQKRETQAAEPEHAHRIKQLQHKQSGRRSGADATASNEGRGGGGPDSINPRYDSL